MTQSRSGGLKGPDVSDLLSAASNENHPESREALLDGLALGKSKAYTIKDQDISDEAKSLALEETAKQYADLAQHSFKDAERAMQQGATRGAMNDIRAGWYQYGVAKGLGANPPRPRFRVG